MQNIVVEIKTALDRLSRLHMPEERTSEFVILLGIYEIEKQREQRLKTKQTNKRKNIFKDYGTATKYPVHIQWK